MCALKRSACLNGFKFKLVDAADPFVFWKINFTPWFTPVQASQKLQQISCLILLTMNWLEQPMVWACIQTPLIYLHCLDQNHLIRLWIECELTIFDLWVFDCSEMSVIIEEASGHHILTLIWEQQSLTSCILQDVASYPDYMWFLDKAIYTEYYF